MANLTIDKVSKRFGAVEVLKEVDLALDDGEFLVLLGPSGCGKSTLLNMIAGLERVSSGEIRIGDRRVNDLAPKDRDIAMVFQSYALYPTMTVRQNIAFPLEMRKASRQEREDAVARVASLLQIDHLLDRRPAELSGGQRQRVAMGRALVRQPQIFLFDEPLSNLDAQLRQDMRAEIKRLHQRLGTTMVYVTHDQIEAMTLATRIAVMKGGSVHQFAPPREVYTRPATQFVASFIGTPPMSMLPGRLAVENGAAHVRVGSHAQPLPIPAADAAALGPRAGGEVIYAVRPEALHLLPPGEGADIPAALTATVTMVEPTGADITVFLDVGEAEMQARVPGHTVLKPGESTRWRIDPAGVSLFDPATGARAAA